MSQDLLDRALAAAVRLHAGQRRRLTGAPYATHPVEVLKRLAEAGVDDAAVLAAAALHDALEDTDLTPEALLADFGPDVAAWVGELTKADGVEKGAYLAGFADASTEALLVKLADRHCNVLDWLTGGDRERAVRYADHASALYDAAEARAAAIAARFGALVALNAAAWVTELRRIAAGELPPPAGRALGDTT